MNPNQHINPTPNPRPSENGADNGSNDNTQSGSTLLSRRVSRLNTEMSQRPGGSSQLNNPAGPVPIPNDIRSVRHRNASDTSEGNATLFSDPYASPSYARLFRNRAPLEMPRSGFQFFDPLTSNPPTTRRTDPSFERRTLNPSTTRRTDPYLVQNLQGELGKNTNREQKIQLMNDRGHKVILKAPEGIESTSSIKSAIRNVVLLENLASSEEVNKHCIRRNTKRIKRALNEFKAYLKTEIQNNFHHDEKREQVSDQESYQEKLKIAQEWIMQDAPKLGPFPAERGNTQYTEFLEREHSKVFHSSTSGGHKYSITDIIGLAWIVIHKKDTLMEGTNIELAEKALVEALYESAMGSALDDKFVKDVGLVTFKKPVKGSHPVCENGTAAKISEKLVSIVEGVAVTIINDETFYQIANGVMRTMFNQEFKNPDTNDYVSETGSNGETYTFMTPKAWSILETSLKEKILKDFSDAIPAEGEEAKNQYIEDNVVFDNRMEYTDLKLKIPTTLDAHSQQSQTSNRKIGNTIEEPIHTEQPD